MKEMTAEKYRELFKARAEGELECMECTKRLYGIIKELYFDGMKILDMPCGVGHYFRKMKDLGSINYIGIDLDSKAIDMAKEIWKDSRNAIFDAQDARDIKLDDKSVDLAYCYNLLLHLKDFKGPLKELFRVSRKYVIVRSLFNDVKSVNTFNISDDYREVYSSGTVQYNTYAREDVVKFLNSLGACKVKFIEDNVSISKENIEEQKKIISVDESEFARPGDIKKESWKGLLLNYEILFIEKE